MRRFRRAMVATWITAVLLLGAIPSAAANQLVPFKATFGGSATTDGTFLRLLGAGTASHLGRITAAGLATVTGPAPDCPGGFANMHVETMTAADGATLTITSLDEACPIGTLRFHGIGVWTVTGATGRLEGTVGHGTLDGILDLSAGTFGGGLSGSIAFRRD
jgi:hypothetical protein